MNSNSNPNGRLAIYANTNGSFYGKRLVRELNRIIKQECSRCEVGNAENPIRLKIPRVIQFGNSMLRVELEENVRGEDAFLVQWFPKPPGVKDSKYESPRNKEVFFHTISALLRSGAKRLSIVTPYAYDQRKDTPEGRDTIGAALFCQELVGITHYERMQGFCLDVHSLPILGYYQLININMVSVPLFRTFIEFIREKHPRILENAVVVLPDLGASKRGHVYSEMTGLPYVIIEKRRISPKEVQIKAFSAGEIDIQGKKAILADDILASGSTASDSITFLRSQGLQDVYWIMSHPEVTDLKKLDEMYREGLFRRIFTADTISLPRDYFTQVPTAKLMSRLIFNVHTDQSIGHYLKFDHESLNLA